MADKTLTIESRTVVSRYGSRESVFAARVSSTVSDYTRSDGELSATETVTLLGIAKMLQIAVEKPLELTLTVGSASVTMTVAEHLTLTAALTSVTLRNPSTDVSIAPIAYRVLYT